MSISVPPLNCHVCAVFWHGSTGFDHCSQSKEPNTSGLDTETQTVESGCVCWSQPSGLAASPNWLHLTGSPRNVPPQSPGTQSRESLHMSTCSILCSSLQYLFFFTSVMLTTNSRLGGSFSGSVLLFLARTRSIDWFSKSAVTLYENNHQRLMSSLCSSYH